ncbi:hypothetical protein [Klebsiella michiganensis]|nr:hypothetical protein [Klebsiella michiganensis]
MSMNFLFGTSGFNVKLHEGLIKKNALKVVAGGNKTDSFFFIENFTIIQ